MTFNMYESEFSQRILSDCLNRPSSNRQLSDLTPHIKRIDGIPINSSVGIDTWLVTFRDEYKFLGTHKQVFMKLSSHDSGARNEGIQYEMLIYGMIRTMIVDSNACPYFVKSLVSYPCCTFYDLFHLVNEKLFDSNKPRRSYDIILHLLRNYLYISGSIQGIQPPIDMSDEIELVKEDTFSRIDQMKYSVLVNEYMSQPFTLAYFINTKLETLKPNIMTNFYTMYFQIACACYAMELFGIMHNDLHDGNVYINIDKEMDSYVYQIDNIYYHCNTHIKTKIYDFDRSYCQSLDDNKYLYGMFDSKFYQSNRLVKGADFLKIVMHFLLSLPKKKSDTFQCLFDQLVCVICERSSNLAKAIYSGDIDYTLEQWSTGKQVDCKDMYPLPVIIGNLAKLANIQVTDNIRNDQEVRYILTKPVADKLLESYLIPTN